MHVTTLPAGMERRDSRSFTERFTFYVCPDYLTIFAAKIEERQYYYHVQTHQLRDKTLTCCFRG